MAEYSFNKQIDIPYEKALEIIPEKLMQEGFGVLTEIDVKATIKKKLDIDFPRYKILGACNPPFAHKALTAEMNIGALLPCNVVVYETGGKTMLSVMRPTVAMGMVDNPEIKDLASEVESKLKVFFDSVN